jgi:hypothetical protein
MFQFTAGYIRHMPRPGCGESVLSPCLRNASHSIAVAIRKAAAPLNGCRFGANSCRAFQLQLKNE